MYKIRNPYKECNILELNMMDVQRSKKLTLSIGEIGLACMPLIIIGLFLLGNFMPSFEVFAACENVGNGDICRFMIE